MHDTNAILRKTGDEDDGAGKFDLALVMIVLLVLMILLIFTWDAWIPYH